jgi:long-chain acyl-CoA synthetase
MSNANPPKAFPAMSIAAAHALMNAPGSPFEMTEAVIGGQRLRVYRNAPPSLREVFLAGRAHGELDCIVYEDERMSFEAQYRAVCALAAQLRTRHGLRKGERVAIAMRNLPEWSVAFWAAAVSGAIVVPLNAWLTGGELEYALADSGSRIALLDHERLTRIAPHRASLPALEALVVTRAPPGELPVPAERWEEILGRTADYAALPDAGLPAVELAPEDDATIFYTSGTTGKPKGALGTHRNICTNLVNVAVAYTRGFLRRGEMPPQPDPAAPKRAALLTVPLFHATGCHSVLVPSLATGAKIVLMYRWDAERALELIERERITGFGGVPTIAWQVVEHPRLAHYDLSSVESVSYGGAPAAPELVARIAEVFPNAQPGNGYGMTETSSITTQNSAEDYRLRPGSVGVPVPVCDLRIVDVEGREVPAGGVGELWIRGPHVVKGYWNKPEATAAAITDGWMHSGDIARIDAEGFVYILDRAKDMLIRGGENIYCVEVEDALFSHPAVVDAAVIGIPHHLLGEEVGAIVQLKDGAEASAAELRAHVAARIAAYKVPVRIELRREPLPRNANGKILKRELKAQWLRSQQ